MHPFDLMPESELAVAHARAEMPLQQLCLRKECEKCGELVPMDLEATEAAESGCPYGVPWCGPR